MIYWAIWTLIAAILVMAILYTYDVRSKRNRWTWLFAAIGLSICALCLLIEAAL